MQTTQLSQGEPEARHETKISYDGDKREFISAQWSDVSCCVVLHGEPGPDAPRQLARVLTQVCEPKKQKTPLLILDVRAVPASAWITHGLRFVTPLSTVTDSVHTAFHNIAIVLPKRSSMIRPLLTKMRKAILHLKHQDDITFPSYFLSGGKSFRTWFTTFRKSIKPEYSAHTARPTHVKTTGPDSCIKRTASL